MTYKIPPSLNWLIDKHARISGEIIRIKRRLTKVSLLVERLNELEKNLDVINQSIKLHNIQIDKNNIKPIRPSRKKSNFPYGEQQNIIFKIVHQNQHHWPVSTSFVMTELSKEHLNYAEHDLSQKELRIMVKQGLNRLVRQGVVMRVHQKATSDQGLWIVHPDYTHQTN